MRIILLTSAPRRQQALASSRVLRQVAQLGSSAQEPRCRAWDGVEKQIEQGCTKFVLKNLHRKPW
jgi:hypothetical protein